MAVRATTAMHRQCNLNICYRIKCPEVSNVALALDILRQPPQYSGYKIGQETARSRLDDVLCEGFFLEKLPQLEYRAQTVNALHSIDAVVLSSGHIYSWFGSRLLWTNITTHVYLVNISFWRMGPTAIDNCNAACGRPPTGMTPTLCLCDNFL